MFLKNFVYEGDLMMKKMLILAMVLALATSASAVSVSVVSGGLSAIDVAPGATVVVDLVSDTDCTGIVAFNVSGDAALTLPSNGTFNSFLDFVTSDALADLEAISTATSGSIAAGSSIFSFSFVAPTVVGTYNIDTGFDADWVSFFDAAAVDQWANVVDGDSLAVTVVPEPMTIALLGLGGLFLRRRK